MPAPSLSPCVISAPNKRFNGQVLTITIPIASDYTCTGLACWYRFKYVYTGDVNDTTTFTDDTVFQVGLAPFSVAIGDLNDDGRPDLATANFFTDDVSVWHSSDVQVVMAERNNKLVYFRRIVAPGETSGFAIIPKTIGSASEVR